MQRTTLLQTYSISKVIKGGWHLAGGHGSIQAEEAIADMLAFVEAGITTFDCADIYTGCLLYTSPSPRDATLSRMPSSA